MKFDILYFNLPVFQIAAQIYSQDILYLLLKQKGIEIGQGCFANCYRLKEVTIPPLITSLKKDSFNSCLSLKRVTFESNTTLISIEDVAFYGCSILVYI